MAFPASSGPRRLVLSVGLLAGCIVATPIIAGATNSIAARDAELSSAAPRRAPPPRWSQRRASQRPLCRPRQFRQSARPRPPSPACSSTQVAPTRRGGWRRMTSMSSPRSPPRLAPAGRPTRGRSWLSRLSRDRTAGYVAGVCGRRHHAQISPGNVARRPGAPRRAIPTQTRVGDTGRQRGRCRHGGARPRLNPGHRST